MDKRDRTVSYRRAEWLNPNVLTLERCVRDACDKLKMNDDRSVIRNDGQVISIARAKIMKKGVLLHITAETQGESASIVPTVSSTQADIDVQTTPPPTGFDFLDGDAFMLVVEDHVAFCSTGLRDGGLTYFLKEIFGKADLRKDSSKFALLKITDANALKLIAEKGVKEIEISATIYQASADYTRRKTQPFSILGAVGRQLRAVVDKENDVTQDSLRVMLTLKVDRRIRGGIKLGEKRVAFLASELLKHQEGADDFVIVTKDGQRISPSEIFLRSTVKITKDGKTVDREEAWKELTRFYKKLEETGVLEGA